MTRSQWGPRRAGALAVVALLSLAACGGGATDGPAEADGETTTATPSAGPGEPRALEAVESSAVEDIPSALDDMTADGLPEPLVEPARIISGGPPPDGIPPIDNPLFQPADAVGWLDDGEAVLALEIDGEARAYPIQIMMWHEIVNDTVQGVPVSVTYCPLCNSAIAFDRRVGDRLVTFGTSGRLYQSDLVMYDRQTESLWPQIEGRAVAGVLTGTELERIPVATVPWGQWRDLHPEGWVLSRETGADRDYGRNPYIGYDEEGSDPFLFDGDADPRLRPKERVVAIFGEQPVAIPLSVVAEQRVVSTEVDGVAVVAWAVDGLRSALDTGSVAKGRELGATGVFEPRIGTRALTFVPAGPTTFRDEQTGSTWGVLGQATTGPLKGKQLTAVPHIDTFWFAWAAFEPDTVLQGVDSP